MPAGFRLLLPNDGHVNTVQRVVAVGVEFSLNPKLMSNPLGWFRKAGHGLSFTVSKNGNALFLSEPGGCDGK